MEHQGEEDEVVVVQQGVEIEVEVERGAEEAEDGEDNQTGAEREDKKTIFISQRLFRVVLTLRIGSDVEGLRGRIHIAVLMY